MSLPDRPTHVGPDSVPEVWKLSVGGLVNARLELSLEELAALGPRETSVSSAECPEGFGTNGYTFEGVPLAVLADLAGVSPDARYVSVQSGPFVASFRLESLGRRGAILATVRDGEPLTYASGGPIRLVPAQGACFDSVKWVERIWLDADGSRATAAEIVRRRRGQTT